MPVNQLPGATPAEPGATPDTPEPTPAAATAPEDTLGDTGLAALKRERELREAAEKREKALDKELRDYRTAKAAADDAEKTDLQKARDRIAELERDNGSLQNEKRDTVLRATASAAARKLGFRNPDIAFSLLDSGAIDIDDKGQPKNIEALLGEIAKANPYLVGSTDFGGGPRGAAPESAPSMNELLRAAARNG